MTPRLKRRKTAARLFPADLINSFAFVLKWQKRSSKRRFSRFCRIFFKRIKSNFCPNLSVNKKVTLFLNHVKLGLSEWVTFFVFLLQKPLPTDGMHRPIGPRLVTVSNGMEANKRLMWHWSSSSNCSCIRSNVSIGLAGQTAWKAPFNRSHDFILSRYRVSELETVLLIDVSTRL